MEQSSPPARPQSPPIIGSPHYVMPVRRGHRGWTVFWVLLGMAAAFVAGGFATSLFEFSATPLAGSQRGRWLEEVVVEQNRSAHKIALVDVEGIITGQSWDRSGRDMVEVIEAQLKLAGKDEQVKAVLLHIDSPGGEVMASDDIARAIANFQTEHKKPVVAFLGGMAASGGYYVAAPCQWLVANELCITGSIGVILQSFNYRGLMDKVGLYPRVYKSGKFKDMLGGSRKIEEIDPREAEMIQGIIDETYQRFREVVSEGRELAQKRNEGAGRSLAENWTEYADGRILTGRQAYEHGFVDENGGFQAAVERSKKIAAISDANLVRYQEPFNLSSLFRIFGQARDTTVKVDVGLDFPKLQAGRPYFLSPSVLH